MATSRTALDESSSTIEFNGFLAIITEDVSGRRAIMMIENLGFFSALERTPGLLASLEYFLSLVEGRDLYFLNLLSGGFGVAVCIS